MLKTEPVSEATATPTPLPKPADIQSETVSEATKTEATATQEAPDRVPKTPTRPKKQKDRRPRIIAFPGVKLSEQTKGKPAQEAPPAPPAPENPSAWVEPVSTDLPPELLEAVFSDLEDVSTPRPDGLSPKRQKQAAKHPAGEVSREEQYRVDAQSEAQHAAPVNPINRLRSKADSFADAMYSQSNDENEELERAEKYIPGTDEEQIKPPVRRPRRPKYVRERAEDMPVQTMAHLYFNGLNFMSRRVILLVILAVVSCYMTLAFGSALPLPGAFADNAKLFSGVQLWLLGWSIVFSLDVIWIGLVSIRERLFTLHTLSSIAVLITVLDALVYISFGRNGSAPYCAPAAVVLTCTTWGAYDRKLANYRACRQAAYSQNLWRITKDEQLWNSRDTFTKTHGGSSGFTSQLQAPSGADRMQSMAAPVIAIAAVLLAAIASLGHARPGLFTWSLSAITLAAAPLSAVLCYGQPWLRLTRRLERIGAAVAGWPGASSSGGENGVLISDSDLFPAGLVQFNGIKVYGKISMEKLTGCTASLVRMSGSGLTELFDGQVRTQGGFYRPVDQFQCHEGGGLSGYIRGEQVLVGSADFMKLMDVPLPQDLKIKHAVYCAIDGALRGIFVLRYATSDSVRPAVITLLQSRLIPVLVPRDFTLTPTMIRHALRLPVERMEYPPVERRYDLTEPGMEHASTLTALLNREGMEAYAETIVGCRRLRRSVRLGALLSIVASVVGLLLGFYLTSAQAFSSLSPFNMIIFLLLWLIPSLLLAGNVNRY